MLNDRNQIRQRTIHVVVAVIVATVQSAQGKNVVAGETDGYERQINDVVATLSVGDNESQLSLSESDIDLLYFCESGRLVTRGIANGTLAGPIDAWIVQQAIPCDQFAKLLAISPEQKLAAKVTSSEYFASPTKTDADREALIRRDRAPGWGYRRWLEENLNNEQKSKLPQIYLQIEGLMALRRPIFRELVGISPKEQKALARVIDEHDGKAKGGDAAVFVSIGPDQRYRLPLFESVLRWQSASLDLELLKLLNRNQRQKLHAVLKKDEHLYKGIHGPGFLSKPPAGDTKVPFSNTRISR